MAENKKAMFIPQGTNVNEIKPLLLGDRFEPLLEYTQGFYCTGEHFLLLEIDDGKTFRFSSMEKTDKSKKKTRIHIINFNKENAGYEHKILTIEVQHCQSNVRKKKSKLDPSSGKFVHMVERFVEEDIVLELYYINVAEFLTMKCNETTIKRNDINLRLSYDAEIYDGFKCELDNDDSSLLIFKAFCNPIYLDDTTYRPWFSMDFIRTDQGKLSHLRRLTFELDVDVFAISTFPQIQVHNEKIYYYKAVRIEDDDEEEAYQLIEYNMEGEIAHTYKEVFPDGTPFKLEFFRGSTLLIIHYPPNRFCIKKVQDGKLTVLSNLEDTFKDFKDKTPADQLHCTRLDSLFNLQRFDQLLLGFSFYESDYQDNVTFATLDLKSGEKVTEIKDSGMLRPKLSMNWNLEEAVVTFYDNSDQVRDGLFFKTYRVNETNQNFSLKHLARLAVLISFNRDYLLMQNMPASLFRYLGLEK